MNRIDSHQHFWKYDSLQHTWMNDDMTILKKDFGIADLEPLLNSCNLNGCVAVQASQSEPENDFLLQLAQQSQIIKGIVGWVDLQSATVEERLNYYTQFSTIKGFRHVIHDEVDLDFMLRPKFLNGIGLLKKFGYTYDILIFQSHLTNTLKFIQQFPEQLFVIDHIAKPSIKNNQLIDWKTQLAAVAAYPNVYCKISGMVTEANWKQWQNADFKIYIDTVVDLFGTNRIMYGSDWPVCTLSATYQQQYNIVQEYFATFSKAEQDSFFGLNATQFYNLK
jgi:L-fuconolactonase